MTASVLIRTADQELKVEDFLLARAAEGGPGKPAVRPGDLIGDVNYMSPERTTGGALPLDHRSGPGDPPYLKAAWLTLDG